MPIRPSAATILPCINLDTAIRFFVRLGFNNPSEEERNKLDHCLIMLPPNGSEIHLRELGPDEEGRLEPLRNPFGIYVYSADVEALAVEFTDEIIEEAKKPEVKEWGLLEFSLNGPDGCAVRVRWPSEEIETEKRKDGRPSNTVD
jgi:hypothetical protein